MYQIILCNCPTMDSAKMIATQLVNDKLAACVNIIPEITSVYVWQGKLITDQEVQLIIKTQSRLFAEVQLAINKLHPYEIPEIIALNIQQGDKHYLHWINESIKP